mgnify:CR=1 FL=1
MHRKTKKKIAGPMPVKLLYMDLHLAGLKLVVLTLQFTAKSCLLPVLVLLLL